MEMDRIVQKSNLHNKLFSEPHGFKLINTKGWKYF